VVHAVWASIADTKVVLGGGADPSAGDRAVAPAVHLAFAIATVVLNVVATFFERSAIGENSTLIDRVAAANRERIAQGIAATELPAAADEATRAGSKVFLFLAANVWLLFGYRWKVMRYADEPLWPYLVLCAVLVFVGLRMRAAEGRRA